MNRESINVASRVITGKKVQALRNEGVLPANIYGKDFPSTSIQISIKDFTDLYKKVRETGLVDIVLEGKKIPTLIHNVQINPLTHQPIHADFFKVNLKEKITTNTPIIAVGEPIAVAEKKGVLFQALDTIEVEALPADLPEQIEVNVESLAEVGDRIAIGKITMPANVITKNDSTQIVFQINELVSKEAEEQAELEVAESEEAKAEAESTETKPENNAPTEPSENPING